MGSEREQMLPQQQDGLSSRLAWMGTWQAFKKIFARSYMVSDIFLRSATSGRVGYPEMLAMETLADYNLKFLDISQ
ncbi:hypothetical protein DD606_25165 [Enterobacter cloacae complex sp. GF14B]|nr:hypothetical protein DD606_25165 [Enterobacter cloacae complex sp. GF14B]